MNDRLTYNITTSSIDSAVLKKRMRNKRYQNGKALFEQLYETKFKPTKDNMKL